MSNLDAKRLFYFSYADCINDLRSILLTTEDPTLKQALTSALENPRQLYHALYTLPSRNVPVDLLAWMLRVACSEDLNHMCRIACSDRTEDICFIGKGAYRTLEAWMQREPTNLFGIEQLQRILGCWRSSDEKGVAYTSNKAGLLNLLRIVAQLPLNLQRNPPRLPFRIN